MREKSFQKNVKKKKKIQSSLSEVFLKNIVLEYPFNLPVACSFV